MFTGELRLFRKMRTISPKPSVTMGQIVAAQTQRRRAEQRSENAGEHGTGRNDQPDRQMQCEMRAGEQRIEIGADGIKSDIAHVEQAGKTDHDIEAERQHDVEHGKIDDAQPGVAKTAADHEGKGGQHNAHGDGRGDGRAVCRGAGFRTKKQRRPSCTLRHSLADQSPKDGRRVRRSARRRRRCPDSYCRGKPPVRSPM